MKNKFLLDLIEELNSCITREEKLETLIFYGNQMTITPLENFSLDDKVSGCTSETYLKLKPVEDETSAMTFLGYSDSLIVKGYLYILSTAYKGYTKEMILTDIEDDIKEFITTAQIDVSLMPSRTNTILNLVMHIKKILS